MHKCILIKVRPDMYKTCLKKLLSQISLHTTHSPVIQSLYLMFGHTYLYLYTNVPFSHIEGIISDHSLSHNLIFPLINNMS